MSSATSCNVIKKTPTIATSYAAADKIVGGLLTLTEAASRNMATLVLYSLVVKHFGTNTNALTVLVFDDLPTGIGADGASLSLSAADQAMLIAAIPIASADYTTAASKATAQPNLKPVVIKPTSGAGRNLYAVVVTTAAATFAATTALSIQFGFLQD